MKKNLKKGFTLIELLVVIAIIGILASVILASLNTARAKGADAAVKEDLDNSRAQAELFYDSQPAGTAPTYTGVCSAASTATPGGIKDLIADAASKNSTTVGNSTQAASASVTVCHELTGSLAGTAWAAEAPLKSTTGYFCVDSTGAAISTPTALIAGAAKCS